MQLQLFTKPDLTNDADPRVTPPAANRVWRISQAYDSEKVETTGSISVFVNGLTAGSADVTDVTATAQMYVRNGTAGKWVAVGTPKVVTSLKMVPFEVPLTADNDDVFLQFTGITGTSLATFNIYYGASGSDALSVASDGLVVLAASESTVATLAYTKGTTTDDAAPADATAVQATISQASRPSSSIVAFAQLVDGGGAAVAGASCSIKAWLRITLPGGSTYTYVDLGQRDGVTQNKLITWAFGAIRGNIELFFQVKNVSGAPTSIKVYAMPGADLPGAYDPATGSLRVGEVFQHGGEQNAIGVHMISRRAHQSADGAPSWDDSAAAEASSVIKAGPGSLYGFIVHNANGGTRWFQIYDSTTVPADGAVPKVSVAIPSGTTVVVNMPFERRWFATGMAWALSSTVATKTIAAADAYAQVAFA